MQTIDDILYINDKQSLLAFCDTIREENILALDTEFIREKTYYPQLCLIQIAAGEHIACIDPLVIDDLEPLMDIIYDQAKIKLFHSARQDLEIFYQIKNSLPSPVFDTQVAATLLGFNDQCGYASLINKMLNITLDKDQARTDWSRRPLSNKQIHYAANDVRYLLQVYPLISQQLEKDNRSQWLKDDFDYLTSNSVYRVEPDKVWSRVSGHNRLKPGQLVILQQLAAWRENTAIKHNRPRRWILADDILISLSQQAPQHLKQLENIRGIKPASIEKFGDSLLETIQAAKDIPREHWPKLPTWQRLSPQQDALVDICMALMKQLAQQNHISPGIISTRKDIEKLVIGETELPLLQGWRKKLVGQPIVDFLHGKFCLAVKNDKLVVEPPG